LQVLSAPLAGSDTEPSIFVGSPFARHGLGLEGATRA